MKKILVGDRNIALQKLIELRLSDRELSVLMTSDTEETEDAMEKGPVDLMILDIDLPTEGALPIYKKLRSSSKLAHVPVMLLVKGMQENDPRLNDFKGLDKALARPFEASDFICAIGQLLDKCSEPSEAVRDLINSIPDEEKDKEPDKEAEIEATQEVQDNILTDLPDSLIEESKKDSHGEITASQEVQDDILSGITDAIIDKDACTGCKTCIDRCHFKAISFVNDKSFVDKSRCAGCGLCVTTCDSNAIQLAKKSKDEEIQTPRNIQDWIAERAKNRGS